MTPTLLSNEAINAAEAMDNTLYELRTLTTCARSNKVQLDQICRDLEEALDTLAWEPRDVRDLRYALRRFGYDEHRIMLPGQESIEYELTAQEYAGVASELADIMNNDGLLLVIEVNEDSIADPQGLPYIRVSVSREVSA